MNEYGCKIDNLLSWQVVVNGVWGTAILICRYGGIGRHIGLWCILLILISTILIR